MSGGSDSSVPPRGCERQPLDGLGALSRFDRLTANCDIDRQASSLSRGLSNGRVELPAARKLEPASATRWRDIVASVGGVLLAWPLARALRRPR